MTAEPDTHFATVLTLPLIMVLQLSFDSTKNHLIKPEIFSLEPWMNGPTKFGGSHGRLWLSGLLESLLDLDGAPHFPKNPLGDTDADPSLRGVSLLAGVGPCLKRCCSCGV